MNIAPDLRNKLLAAGGFVLVGATVLYMELRDSSPAPVVPVVSAPAAVRGNAAKAVGTTAAQLDPTLKMGPMLVTESLGYSGSGRNIFSAASAPVEIPKPIAAVRPKGPVVPVYTPPPGPPPPPPIDLKFFGTATSADGKRKAFLLKGDDVFLASDGDIVQRRYRVGVVGANSVVVEDMTNNNRQTLPLIGH